MIYISLRFTASNNRLMNTSTARTPFMDYETRKKIKGRKYVFQNQKKNFISNENPRSVQKTKLLSSFAWLQWNPAEFYFGPNLPNGADKQ